MDKAAIVVKKVVDAVEILKMVDVAGSSAEISVNVVASREVKMKVVLPMVATKKVATVVETVVVTVVVTVVETAVETAVGIAAAIVIVHQDVVHVIDPRRLVEK